MREAFVKHFLEENVEWRLFNAYFFITCPLIYSLNGVVYAFK